MKSSPAILQAREALLTGQHLPQGAVAEAIERSWRRCLEHGIDSASPHDTVITAAELARRRDKNHLLITHAQPEMATLTEQIAHTRSMVILTDDTGVILHSMGDQNMLSESQRHSLAPGVSWHEDHRGTNAIGTALIERSAMTVQGAEHFMEYHHLLSCSAVPIFGARNELLGALDVSNDHAMPQQHTLALVKMAAQMIENRLFNACTDAEIVLHFHARPEFIGTLWEGIAMFAADGTLRAINRSGQFQLGVTWPHKDIAFDLLFETPLGLALAQNRQGSQLVFPLRMKNGARIYARLESTASSQRVQHAPLPMPPKTSQRNTAATLDMLDSGDAQLANAIRQAKQVLDRNIPILIQGETGVGKELFARAIHEASTRRDGPWIAVNCAALPEGLIEAELFGHEEGAFTGARRKGNPGKLEQADGGTLFLDEIGDMPLSLQARLLRVLQERSVTRLGSSQSKSVDFVLISATNQKLRENVENGTFRSDLYYRLNGLSVSLPPLRQRTDMDALIQMILQVEQASDVEITPEVMAVFSTHPWPGNIRQLHNVLRTALALADGAPINAMHLTQDFLDESYPQATTGEISTAGALEQLATEAVRAAVQQHSGNISAAARQLGISRNTLYRRLKIAGLA